MSLLLKCKDVLFQDIVKKTVSRKSFLGKKLKRISLKEVEKYLKERAFLENFLKALSNEELLTDLEEADTKPAKSLKAKVLLLKKLLAIKHITILAITYFPKVIKPLFIDTDRPQKTFQIILDSKTASDIKKMDEDSPKLITLLKEKIKPLLDEKDNLLNVKLIRYEKNFDIILLYQTNFPTFLTEKLNNSIVLLVKKVIKQQAMLAATNSLAQDQKNERKEALHKGLKNLFLEQKKNNFDKAIKTIMDSFSLKTILLLKRIDSENEIYQVKDFYGSGKHIREDVQLDMLDILSLHTDQSIGDKIFSNPKKTSASDTVIFQALFLNGPEKVAIPITAADNDSVLEKTENLKILRALLEHLFLSEDALK